MNAFRPLSRFNARVAVTLEVSILVFFFLLCWHCIVPSAALEQTGHLEPEPPDPEVVARLLDEERQLRASVSWENGLTGGLTDLAHEYQRAGEVERAYQIFQELAESEGHTDLPARLNAYRMLGQMNLFEFASPREAIVYYDALAELAATAPEPLRTAHLAEAYGKASEAYEQLSDYLAGAEQRELYLELGTGGEEERAFMMLGAAQDYANAGASAEAIATYDRLFQEYPAFGRDRGNIVDNTGNIVDMNAAQIRAQYESGSPPYVNAMLALWSREDLKQYPQIVNIGRYVAASALESQDYGLLEAVAREVLALVEEKMHTWDTQAMRRYRVDEHYMLAVLHLGEFLEQYGRGEEAVALYTRALTLFPDSQRTEELRRRLQRQQRTINSQSDFPRRVETTRNEPFAPVQPVQSAAVTNLLPNSVEALPASSSTIAVEGASYHGRLYLMILLMLLGGSVTGILINRKKRDAQKKKY